MFLDENSINKEREQQFIHQLEMPFTSQIRFDDLLKNVLKLRGGGAGSSGAGGVGAGVHRKREVNDELRAKLREFKLEDEAELFAEKGGVICVEDLEQIFLDENSINKEREQQFIHQLEMPFTSQIRFDDLLKDVLKLRGGGAGSSVPLKTKSKLAQEKAALEEQLAHLSPGTINVKVRIGGLFEATRQSELVSLSVNSTTTVAKVKEMIFDMVDIPVDTQRLCVARSCQAQSQVRWGCLAHRYS